MKNQAGKFVEPTIESTTAAAAAGGQEHAGRLPGVARRTRRGTTPTRSRASPGSWSTRTSRTRPRARRSWSSSGGRSTTASGIRADLLYAPLPAPVVKQIEAKIKQITFSRQAAPGGAIALGRRLDARGWRTADGRPCPRERSAGRAADSAIALYRDADAGLGVAGRSLLAGGLWSRRSAGSVGRDPRLRPRLPDHLALGSGAGEFGALPFIYGTLVSSLLALLSRCRSRSARRSSSPSWRRAGSRPPVAFLVELLAAMPSVVYGLWGIFVLVPLLRDRGRARARTDASASCRSSRARPTASSMLAGALILAIMILPTITSVSREVLRAVPERAARGRARRSAPRAGR